MSGCARASTKQPIAVAAPNVTPATFPDDPAPLLRYHSSRLAIAVPLPDGRAWRIDDHSQPELVATHAPTRSRLVVAVFRADELVGRTQCETLARARGLVPAGDPHTLEDETMLTQQTFDTRIWVAVEPGGGPENKLVGHVMAFGGFLRKCFAFVFSTQVDAAADEPILSSRLAFARARILAGLVMDPFDTLPRALPPVSGSAPAP